MGYFASLLRQTGIQVGPPASRPAAAVKSLEHEETRQAEPPPPQAFSVSESPHAAGPPRDPLPRAAAATPPAPAPGPTPADPPPPAAMSGPPAQVEAVPSTREVIVETITSAPAQVPSAVAGAPERAAKTEAPAPPTFETRPRTATAIPTLPASAKLAPAAGEPEVPRPSRGPRLPTFADVRAWVAQPIPELGEVERDDSRLVPRPEVSRASHLGKLGADRSDAFTLEIGTIQVLMDGPAVSEAPLRAAPSRPSTPSKLPSERASRHYLRP